MPAIPTNDTTSGNLKGSIDELTNNLLDDHANDYVNGRNDGSHIGYINGLSDGDSDSLWTSPMNNNFGDKIMPIAVVGLACRFPQDATSPEKFWQMLVEGRSARSEVPKDRFNIDAFHHAGDSRTGSVWRYQHLTKSRLTSPNR